MWGKPAAGNYINEVVTVKEGGHISWRIHLEKTSTVSLSVVLQDGDGAYCYTMDESEYNNFSNGTYRYFPDLSSENIKRFISGNVNLRGGSYRIVVGLNYIPDGYGSYSKTAVRFEIVK